jgi:hypothetical protein
MRLLVISLLLFVFNSFIFSQVNHVNCIIFIDGKLPEGSWMYNEYFLYIDSVGNEKKIDFDYVIGEIQLTQENSNILHSLNPKDDLTINFTYKKYDGQTFIYSGVLKVAWLSYRYLVIRITNLNKKTGEYYFGYSTPGISKKLIKKEYNMFEDYK